MLTVNPYLNFAGNAEEAFTFYRSVFGGEFLALQRFKDVPDTDNISEAERDKIMHVSLPIGKQTILMASDTLESLGHKLTVGNNFYLSLEAESKEEADRLFNALSVGGTIEMPLQDMFWGAYWGAFKDKFGVQWMVSYDKGTAAVARQSGIQKNWELTGDRMQKITPHLWFDDQAEEAAEFYTSVFPNSEIVSVSRYSDVGHEVHGRPAGSVMTVTFTLDGQTFIALNGGPHFKFSEAISFFISCATQEEVDYYWERLAAGGEEGPCGWLKDKYGLSWQVVPTALGTLLEDKEAGKADRVMEALLQMKKIDIAALQRVYDGQHAG